MDVQNIKSRIFKDEYGISNYINVSIEEMDWLVNQAEQLEKIYELLTVKEMDIFEFTKQTLAILENKEQPKRSSRE